MQNLPAVAMGVKTHLLGGGAGNGIRDPGCPRGRALPTAQASPSPSLCTVRWGWGRGATQRQWGQESGCLQVWPGPK